MAHTKSAGAAHNLRDSNAQYLGVKKYAGERAKSGDILVRQRGSTFLAGKNVRQGKDYTLYAVASGVVSHTEKRKIRFDGNTRRAKVVSVVAAADKT